MGKKQEADSSSSKGLVARLKRSLASTVAPPRETQESIVVPATLVFHVRRKGENAEVRAPEATEITQGLASLATALWRIRSKLMGEALPELPHELRHLPRHLQAAWDALEACHIKVQDHRDERYFPGMAVNPITFQPTAGVATEVICETIKPSVFYGDTLIQRADVIVAQPLEEVKQHIQSEYSGTESDEGDTIKEE